MIKRYDITPMGKPRMTRSDKWKQRDCVMRYRAFKDECRYKGVELPESNAHVVFVVPMPKSWSQKKKREMLGAPHRQKPDVDNMLKALMDALFEEDSAVWDVRATKIWGETGSIKVQSNEFSQAA